MPCARPIATLCRHLWRILRPQVLMLLTLSCAYAFDGANPPGRTGSQALSFGVLPLSGPLESRRDWQPLIDEMGTAIGQPIRMLSVTSYEALEAAIQRQEVDIAFLSGKMTLNAVTQHGMRVIAQVTRDDGLPGYRAVLLARRGGPVTRENLYESPGRWRLARGSDLSMSGYVVPHLQLFLPHGIQPERYFLSETIATHQDNALAVANGEADLATNNTADLERFRSRFPAEYEQLEVLWESELIPHAQIVVRSQLPSTLRHSIARFLLHYGQSPTPESERQRKVLQQLHGFAGFLPADGQSLESTASINHALARQSALKSQWVSTQALQERLRRLDDAHQALLQQLRSEP
ncbi:phosphate/phosphite/phosphonate ABC transporter substrate-binding protein [Corticibacter populi]|uniref:Phosphate/phosphite/phosphonate ABC transporter substrate-binding protein n=1 Tax=Corticibacter populi TaxID=1550736 RepID=A0A3M6QMH4_9BURK|nr:phosphate/phosphite/phosphonate ABC transporter substrate-binding protein [Corticibacter populi]RMX04246.1 phosphate/phosphite/phosphonate ABC transporter substrate-binding protein [Corticibacter populi]RZS33288.1 phosphonate transport system substrate-binding protein [Corticibacter populi]